MFTVEVKQQYMTRFSLGGKFGFIRYIVEQCGGYCEPAHFVYILLGYRTGVSSL